MTKIKSTSHGICKKCNHEIICIDNINCNQHAWITAHIDPNECIEILKKENDEMCCDFDCDACRPH